MIWMTHLGWVLGILIIVKYLAMLL